MRHILIITPGGISGRGGMARMAAYFTRRLALQPEFPFEVLDTHGPGVNTTRGKLTMPFRFLWALAGLAARCARRKVALAHVHMAVRGSVYRKLAVMWLCHRAKVPVLLHLHGGSLDRFCAKLGPRGLTRLRRYVSLAAEVIVVGEYWRRFVIDVLGAAPERVTVLHNAFAGPSEVPTREPRHECEFLFLAAVTPDKGMDELLAALASPALAIRAWRMTIAGIARTPRELDRYRAVAEGLSLAKRVHFMGWVDEAATRSLLERCEVLVLPSHFEAMPMSVIEAMAYGLAIVVTPVGSVTEMISDGDNGLIVPIGDSKRLAEALARLADDPALRQRLGASARAQFMREHDLEIFHDRITRLYRRHLAAVSSESAAVQG